MVTTLVRELLQRRIIVEVGPVHMDASRHPVGLNLNRRRNFVAGLCLCSANMSAVRMDLNGTVMASARLEVDAQGKRQSLLGKMFRCLEKTMEEARITSLSSRGSE
jgi:hypothetical protein